MVCLGLLLFGLVNVCLSLVWVGLVWYSLVETGMGWLSPVWSD